MPYEAQGWPNKDQPQAIKPKRGKEELGAWAAGSQKRVSSPPSRRCLASRIVEVIRDQRVVLVVSPSPTCLRNGGSFRALLIKSQISTRGSMYILWSRRDWCSANTIVKAFRSENKSTVLYDWVRQNIPTVLLHIPSDVWMERSSIRPAADPSMKLVH